MSCCSCRWPLSWAPQENARAFWLSWKAWSSSSLPTVLLIRLYGTRDFFDRCQRVLPPCCVDDVPCLFCLPSPARLPAVAVDCLQLHHSRQKPHVQYWLSPFLSFVYIYIIKAPSTFCHRIPLKPASSYVCVNTCYAKWLISMTPPTLKKSVQFLVKTRGQWVPRKFFGAQ